MMSYWPIPTQVRSGGSIWSCSGEHASSRLRRSRSTSRWIGHNRRYGRLITQHSPRRSNSSRVLNLLQQILEPFPRFFARLLVRFVGVGGFARAHEAMSGAVVGHRLVGLPGLLHQLGGFWDGGIDAFVVAAVKAIHRAVDAGDVLFPVRARAVECKPGFDVPVVRRKSKRLSAAPAESAHRHLAVAGPQLSDVV